MVCGTQKQTTLFPFSRTWTQTLEPAPNFFSDNIEELRENFRVLCAEKRSLLIRLHREEVPHETIADNVADLLGEIALLKEESKQLRAMLPQVQESLATTQGQLATNAGSLATTQGRLTTTEGQLITTQGRLAMTEIELGEVKAKLHLWEHKVFIGQAAKAFEKRILLFG